MCRIAGVTLQRAIRVLTRVEILELNDVLKTRTSLYYRKKSFTRACIKERKKPWLLYDSLILYEKRRLVEAFFLCANFRINAWVCREKRVCHSAGKWIWRWKLCELRLHWHVQSVNSVITIWQKTREFTQSVWKRRSIVRSAEHTHYTKRPNNLV